MKKNFKFKIPFLTYKNQSIFVILTQVEVVQLFVVLHYR